MKEYSKQELDKKIHSFLSSKMKKYPDLIQRPVDINHRAEARVKKMNWVSSFMPIQLKTSI